jgi:hypothetical protein
MYKTIGNGSVPTGVNEQEQNSWFWWMQYTLAATATAFLNFLSMCILFHGSTFGIALGLTVGVASLPFIYIMINDLKLNNTEYYLVIGMSLLYLIAATAMAFVGTVSLLELQFSMLPTAAIYAIALPCVAASFYFVSRNIFVKFMKLKDHKTALNNDFLMKIFGLKNDMADAKSKSPDSWARSIFNFFIAGCGSGMSSIALCVLVMSFMEGFASLALALGLFMGAVYFMLATTNDYMMIRGGPEAKGSNATAIKWISLVYSIGYGFGRYETSKALIAETHLKAVMKNVTFILMISILVGVGSFLRIFASAMSFIMHRSSNSNNSKNSNGLFSPSNGRVGVDKASVSQNSIGTNCIGMSIV